MSRSGYSEDCDDHWQAIMWRGAVASAIRGKRGQEFLREMLAALDAVESHRLIADNLKTKDGEVCALGAVAAARGLDVSAIDPEDYATVANVFGLPRSLAQEIMFENDEAVTRETPEARYIRIRSWIAKLIKPATP